MRDLQMLSERYSNQIKELEARMADVKHKFEVVMEATKLLQAEGFSDERPRVTFPENRPFPGGM